MTPSRQSPNASKLALGSLLRGNKRSEMEIIMKKHQILLLLTLLCYILLFSPSFSSAKDKVKKHPKNQYMRINFIYSSIVDILLKHPTILTKTTIDPSISQKLSLQSFLHGQPNLNSIK